MVQYAVSAMNEILPINYAHIERQMRKAPPCKFQVMTFDSDEDRYSIVSKSYARRSWALRRANKLSEYARLRGADSIEFYFVTDDQGSIFDEQSKTG